MRTFKTLIVLAATLLTTALALGSGEPSTTPSTQVKPKLGDVNNDYAVNAIDLVLILQSWGACPSDPCAADLNGDFFVDESDLKIVLMHWD